jgi:hypothetical protein
MFCDVSPMQQLAYHPILAHRRMARLKFCFTNYWVAGYRDCCCYQPQITYYTYLHTGCSRNMKTHNDKIKVTRLALI